LVSRGRKNTHSAFPSNKYFCEIPTRSTLTGTLNTAGVYRDFCQGHQGCHRYFFPVNPPPPVKYREINASGRSDRARSSRQHGCPMFSSLLKTSPHEIDACRSGRHHRCLMCFNSCEKFPPPIHICDCGRGLHVAPINVPLIVGNLLLLLCVHR